MYAIYIHENHRIFDYNSTTQICNYRLLQIFKGSSNYVYFYLQIIYNTRYAYYRYDRAKANRIYKKLQFQFEL